MLLSIREKATGWVAYAIVFFISIPFALWGIQQYFGWSDAPIVLEVGDAEVSTVQLGRAFAQRKRDVEAATQGGEMPPDQAILSQVVGEYLGRELLTQAIVHHGYEVADAVLARTITELPQFQTDGVFDARKYTSFLQAQRIPKTAFEDNYREQLKRDQFLDAVRVSSFILEGERRRYAALFNQQRKVRYVVVAADNFIEPGSVDDEQARRHYDDNRDHYRSMLRARFRYVEIKADELVDAQVLGEDEIAQYYEANAEEFSSPERRRLRYILVSDEERDAPEVAARVEEINARLAAGDDFADVARRYSDDPLTAEDGGELPWLGVEDVGVDAVREVVFALGEGQVSEPLAGDAGVQIFQLAEIEPFRRQPLAEVRDELVQSLKTQRAEETYSGLVNELSNLAYEQGELFFRVLTREYGNLVRIRVSDWLEADEEEGLFAYPRAKQIALTRLVAGEEYNSGLVEVERGHALFFALEEKIDPLPQEFDAVREDIIAGLLARRAEQAARARRDEWLATLRAGTATLDSLTADGAFTPVDAGYIHRFDTEHPAAVVEVAFLMRQSQDAAAYDSALVEGDVAIVELSGVRVGDDLEPEALSYSDRETQAVVESLRGEFKVKLHQERLQELLEESF